MTEASRNIGSVESVVIARVEVPTSTRSLSLYLEADVEIGKRMKRDKRRNLWLMTLLCRNRNVLMMGQSVIG